MSKTIIGVVGLIGSGKDTVAEYIGENYGFEHESFAATLKDAVAAVFGWERSMLEGKTTHARAARETVDEWWAERLGMPDLTPRWVLQYWGTDLCRNHFHTDIWVAALEHKVHMSTADIVISDCRFPNEIEVIRKMGGKVIWVQRGYSPDWFNTAIAAAQGNKSAIEIMNNKNIHASEWAWADTDFDHVIHNDGTLDQLYEMVDNLQICNWA